MAVKEYMIRVRWENGVSFEMEEKEGEGDWTTTIDMEENTHIAHLTGHIQGLCSTAFNHQLGIILQEMAA